MALPLIIVTGVSGAGRTTASKALEDMGYQVTDNLPLAMIPALVEHSLNDSSNISPIVVGVRTLDFSATEVTKILESLRENPIIDLRIIYLECSEDMVMQRYGESRRPHPIDAKNLQEAVRAEKKLLEPLKKIAEMQLDTSNISIRHLRKILQHHFTNNAERSLKIQLVSFAYKNGFPRFADLVLDMRFLTNPFYDRELRPLTGLDKPVQEYVQNDPRWMIVEHHFKEFIIHAIDGYKEQGRFYLTIAFGCTGGQHRSVFVAEFFNKLFLKMAYDCIVEHCDLEARKL